MPYAMTIDKLAAVLTGEAVQATLEGQPEVLERLRERGSLLDVAAELGGLADHEKEYLASIPPTLLEAMRGAVVEALAAGKAVHVQYSPGYDFEIRLWDYGDAVSVHVTGPYPPQFPRDGFKPASP